jgi:tetratricopeptide (TPR) repeat protein
MMSLAFRLIPLAFCLFFLPNAVLAQAEDACGEFGGSVWLSTKVVYGRVKLVGIENSRRPPKVSVTLMNAARMAASTTLDGSGNYCFQDVDGSGSSLVVEVEGREVAREVLPSIGSKQFKQDFSIDLTSLSSTRRPGVISAKFQYPRTSENQKLFEDAEAALDASDSKKAEELFKKLVAADPKDYIAWAKLGGVYFDKKDLSNAEKALQQAVELRKDLSPAMVNLGRVYLMQQKVDAAIDILKKSIEADPASARSFQLLGEAYLVARKGSLAVGVLNEAIRLDPVGMAECHLLMATLYDRAGAPSYASREYKLFLAKVPNHPDAKKFSKYIKDHPPEESEN